MSFLSKLSEDCRFSLRMFRKSPGFHFVAAGSMALGIGAASAIFSLAWAILLDPFPYRDPSSILTPSWYDRQNEWGSLPFNVGDADDMRREARTFTVMFSRSQPTVATGALPEQLTGRVVSPNTFSLLGVAPAAGRFFTESDVPVPAAPPPVAVL